MIDIRQLPGAIERAMADTTHLPRPRRRARVTCPVIATTPGRYPPPAPKGSASGQCGAVSLGMAIARIVNAWQLPEGSAHERATDRNRANRPDGSMEAWTANRDLRRIVRDEYWLQIFPGMLMDQSQLKKFLHPAGVYRLEYPSYWDQIQKDEARSCGFGPHERDDVGLWISLMPVSVDSERMAEELPKILTQVLPQMQGGNVRRDPTLRHYGVKADMHKEGEGGHYWLIAGGDVVLFASSQVPIAERDVWNPPFERLMASLEITRDEELALRQLTTEVMMMLRERHPDEEFQIDEKGIRGRNRVVFLSNLHREVRSASPSRRGEIIEHFVDSLAQSMDLSLGYETWEDARTRLLPLLKPRSYLESDTASRHSLVNEWLADVVICYALRSKDIFRFVTTADAERWEMNAESIHEVAIENLSQLPWPSKLEGARQSDGGRLIVVVTGDGLASSRLLHPELHRLFSGPLGSPFRAGIPDRDTLIVYSDRHRLRLRTERQLRKDYRTSGYPITPRPFLVTPDGIAPARA
jgi:uncharacterized protein YtpQ (UPF0354 family)